MGSEKNEGIFSETFMKLPIRIRQTFPRSCGHLYTSPGPPREGDIICKENSKKCTFNSPETAREYECHKLRKVTGNGRLTNYEIEKLTSLGYFRHLK
jgi:hypothetical protein